MARKGGRGKAGRARKARASAPLLAPARLSTSDGRVPFHFEHVVKPRKPGDAAHQQRYTDRSAVHDVAPAKEDQQAYIDRIGAADADLAGELVAGGTIGDGLAARFRFWQEREAADPTARIQARIIAEFPHEVSHASRRTILAEFGRSAFESRNLPWAGAGHAPDAHNDARNFHCHIVSG